MKRLTASMYKLKARNPGQRWVYVWLPAENPQMHWVIFDRTLRLDQMLLKEWGYVDKDREWGVDGPMEAFVGLEPDDD